VPSNKEYGNQGEDNSFDLIDLYTNIEQAAEHLASACEANAVTCWFGPYAPDARASPTQL
jgi:hypothetical protein